MTYPSPRCYLWSLSCSSIKAPLTWCFISEIPTYIRFMSPYSHDCAGTTAMADKTSSSQNIWITFNTGDSRTYTSGILTLVSSWTMEHSSAYTTPPWMALLNPISAIIINKAYPTTAHNSDDSSKGVYRHQRGPQHALHSHPSYITSWHTKINDPCRVNNTWPHDIADASGFSRPRYTFPT